MASFVGYNLSSFYSLFGINRVETMDFCAERMIRDNFMQTEIFQKFRVP